MKLGKAWWKLRLKARLWIAPLLSREVVYYEGNNVQFIITYPKDRQDLRKEALAVLKWARDGGEG